MGTFEIRLSNVETQLPLRLALNRYLTDDELFEFCALNSELQVERSAEGEVIVMPPAGGESSGRNMEISMQLRTWSKGDGRGRAFDSSAGFFLPNGAMRSPDAAWIENSRLRALSREEKRRFIYLCPNFVIELLSPSDRLHEAKRKMTEWMANGAELGWLIDADNQAVYVYRRCQEAELIVGLQSIAGEGPVNGFSLDLQDVFGFL